MERYDLFTDEQLQQLRALNFNNSLENIFAFPQNASSFLKVQCIIKIIEKYLNKPVINLINDYKNFYFTNIIRFWMKLPGGKQFLESEEIRRLSDEEKVERFKIWIADHNNTENITSLKINGFDLATLSFIPLEINQFTNLQELDLRHNQIEFIPFGLNLPQLKIFDLKNNQIETIPERLPNLPCLQGVYLRNNPIRQISANLDLFILNKNNKERLIGNFERITFRAIPILAGCIAYLTYKFCHR